MCKQAVGGAVFLSCWNAFFDTWKRQYVFVFLQTWPSPADIISILLVLPDLSSETH